MNLRRTRVLLSTISDPNMGKLVTHSDEREDYGNLCHPFCLTTRSLVAKPPPKVGSGALATKGFLHAYASKVVPVLN
jgi:hypothetical protein